MPFRKIKEAGHTVFPIIFKLNLTSFITCPVFGVSCSESLIIIFNSSTTLFDFSVDDKFATLRNQDLISLTVQFSTHLFEQHF